MRAEERDLAHRIQRLVFRLNRELRTEAAELGVSAADAMVLFDIRRHPGVGVSQLAGLQDIARSVMSERIKRLTDWGLVKKDTEGLVDRRRVGLTITDAGRTVLARITQGRRDRMADRLAALPEADRRAIAQAVNALDRLSEWRSEAELAARALEEGADININEKDWEGTHHERKIARST